MAMIRFRSLDILRGAALCSMFLYHAVWDLVYLYQLQLPWFRSTPGYIWQQSICWSFILLSGFCWGLGRRPFRRGMIVLLSGCLVTAVTLWVLPEQPVFFGILTFLGTAMLLMIPLDRLFRHFPASAGAIGAFLIFLLTRNVNRGTLGFEGLTFWKLPVGLYRSPLTTFFGFPMPDFYSSDYFSLLPWFFLFLTGYFLCRLRPPVQRDPVLSKAPDCLTKPFVWCGRHSLLLYLLHQPLLYGAMELLLSAGA